MSEPTHLLIAFAAGSTPAAREALRALRLPRLERLLQRLQPLAPEPVDELAPEAPHERALARLLGLDAGPGRTPWAAHALHHAGRSPGPDAWAWITPCHWKVGMDQVLMQDPAALDLHDEHARELFAALQTWFADDGIDLHFETPQRWLARGELFRDLVTTSLDRVSGRDVGAWMPESPQARTLHRLQSEMQMLLYTHPVNDARAAQGLPAVNSFWVSGAGALPEAVAAAAAPEVDLSLRDSALRQDWATWAQAWRQLDATRGAALLAAQERGAPVRLTLCGERAWQAFEAAPRGLFQRISGIFGTKPASMRLEQL
jgi:hypothetical protein